MRIIKSYSLFEQEKRKKDVIDGIMSFLPSLANDPFTLSILPHIRRIIHADDNGSISESCDGILELARNKFAGFDKMITMQEVMERFINHYIDPDTGILKKREVRKLIRDIKPPVKKSVKRDGEYRITAQRIDNFTDRSIRYLERQGIKKEDIKNSLKGIYNWFSFVFKHFYHLDTIKGMKYMQVGVLFNQDELNSYLGLTGGGLSSL